MCSSSECKYNWSTYNKCIQRGKIICLKNKELKYDEVPLICEDIASDDEWFVNDEVKVTLSKLQEKDLNVDLFDGARNRVSTSTITSVQKAQTKKKYIKNSFVRTLLSLNITHLYIDEKYLEKRKITDIEEEEADWETLNFAGDELWKRVVHYDDDSNEDSLNDNSANDF
ncbi:hypothetical protein M5K25_003733 [Dendrobium thyrsiflorum]|uniref:Uncharacterized protein n=1 Tax=Dendrobium thyrsiflorum TaxID=117978 RepID=A0ABD0VSJ3_DENTH